MGRTAARSEGPDDLWTGFEILEGGAFGHEQTLIRPLPCLKQSSSDKAPWSQLFPAEQARIILLLVRRVTVTAAGLKVDIRREMVAPRRLEAAE